MNINKQTNKQTQKSHFLIAGFYRQWTHENLSKEEAQQKGIEILIEQIEKAALEKKEMIIMGDANLCSAKWKEPNFVHKKLQIS